MEEWKSLITWVKSHKKELIIAGISLASIIGIILAIKNKNALMELWATLEISIKKVTKNTPTDIPAVQTSVPAIETVAVPRAYTPPQAPFHVSQHIRTLSGSRQHSAEKAAKAAAIGIVLLPSQTLVDSYTKCAAA